MNGEVFDCVFNLWTGFAGKETCEAGYLDCKKEDCPMYQKAEPAKEKIQNGSI